MRQVNLPFLPLTILILFINLLSLSSCSKDGCGGCECIRPVTTNGANTISCLINGEPWSSCAGTGNSLGGEPTDAISFQWNNTDGHNYMRIAGYQFVNSNENVLEITLNPPTEERIHSYNQRRFRLYLDQFTKYNPGKLAEYKMDTTKPWQIDVLRFDQERRIVSGTFFGTVHESLLKKDLIITEGQFDIKY